MKESLTISVKDATKLSKLPATFIRKQVENRVIPKAYSIQNLHRKSYIIYRKPFMEWLEELQGGTCG